MTHKPSRYYKVNNVHPDMTEEERKAAMIECAIKIIQAKEDFHARKALEEKCKKLNKQGGD